MAFDETFPGRHPKAFFHYACLNVIHQNNATGNFHYLMLSMCSPTEAKQVDVKREENQSDEKIAKPKSKMQIEIANS